MLSPNSSLSFGKIFFKKQVSTQYIGKHILHISCVSWRGMEKISIAVIWPSKVILVQPWYSMVRGEQIGHFLSVLCQSYFRTRCWEDYKCLNNFLICLSPTPPFFENHILGPWKAKGDISVKQQDQISIFRIITLAEMRKCLCNTEIMLGIQ